MKEGGEFWGKEAKEFREAFIAACGGSVPTDEKEREYFEQIYFEVWKHHLAQIKMETMRVRATETIERYIKKHHVDELLGLTSKPSPSAATTTSIGNSAIGYTSPMAIGSASMYLTYHDPKTCTDPFCSCKTSTA